MHEKKLKFSKRDYLSYLRSEFEIENPESDAKSSSLEWQLFYCLKMPCFIVGLWHLACIYM